MYRSMMTLDILQHKSMITHMWEYADTYIGACGHINMSIKEYLGAPLALRPLLYIAAWYIRILYIAA